MNCVRVRSGYEVDAGMMGILKNHTPQTPTIPTDPLLRACTRAHLRQRFLPVQRMNGIPLHARVNADKR